MKRIVSILLFLIPRLAGAQQLVHTKLNVQFDYDKRYLHGQEWISVKAAGLLVLDAKGMDIHQVSHKGKQLNFRYDSLKLFIRLPENPAKYTIYIDYTAKTYERKGI